MAPLLFAVLVLATTTLHGVVGQKAGFVSIDCGLEGTSGYTAEDTGIVYVSDGPYVDTGENHRLLPGEEGQRERRYLTVRSFPSGVRNCYSLPTVAGAKYLFRVVSYYGNYDGKDDSLSSSTSQFDLHLGATYWDTVSNSSYWFREAMFVAWASGVPLCLINTGRGTPFVSAVELRPLGSELYPALNAIESQSMRLVQRTNMGPSKSRILRYPDDPYDRRWLRMQLDRTWKNLSTVSTIKDTSLDYAVPLPVMQTAAEAVSNETSLAITGEYKAPMDQLEVFLHFADFQNSQLRQFSISFNKKASVQMRPSYLATDTLHSTYKATGDVCTMTLTPTSESTLRPMLNAFEVYTVIPRDNPMTFPRDFDTIMAIKIEYGIKKNWMGDPCFPTEFAWNGVKCSNVSGNNTARIISLDLSYSNLHGAISNNFTLLISLEYFLPIIHRDVKASNILLSQNLQAKIADFGLSKSYLSETQTHISVTPAGTAGYMDPEYFYPGRLTESSDVYSFGVVLLEIATGESPILPELGHIVHRVKNKIAIGNISLVADTRLRGSYEVSSMWKVVDTALFGGAGVTGAVAGRPWSGGDGAAATLGGTARRPGGGEAAQAGGSRVGNFGRFGGSR
uniref:Protein kinase domain-containing protein n=1 Tax=Oryza meridionalis TaxID=40149 RepID=A0A0E0ER51_9ORYZ